MNKYDDNAFYNGIYGAKKQDLNQMINHYLSHDNNSTELFIEHIIGPNSDENYQQRITIPKLSKEDFEFAKQYYKIVYYSSWTGQSIQIYPADVLDVFFTPWRIWLHWY